MTKPTMPLRPQDPLVHPPAYTEGYRSSTTRAPGQPLVALDAALCDTSGPAFGHGDVATLDNDLLQNFAAPGASPVGERIVVHGHVLDQNIRPVDNTLVEIWQANAGGRYRHKNDTYLAPVDPNFSGCGRTITDTTGYYLFQTVKPGAYPWPNWTPSWRPAHIHFSVFGHSFTQRLITQMYFEGDPLVPLCPIVRTIPDEAAIDRLIARLDMEASTPFDCLAYRFDIVLRGPGATLFENRPEGD